MPARVDRAKRRVTKGPQPCRVCGRPLTAAVERRLADLDQHLRGRDYLLEDFTVADILMVSVLRFIRHTDMVADFSAVAAYVARCTDRPAFVRALDAQLTELREPIAA